MNIAINGEATSVGAVNTPKEIDSSEDSDWCTYCKPYGRHCIRKHKHEGCEGWKFSSHSIKHCFEFWHNEY